MMRGSKEIFNVNLTAAGKWKTGLKMLKAKANWSEDSSQSYPVKAN